MLAPPVVVGAVRRSCAPLVHRQRSSSKNAKTKRKTTCSTSRLTDECLPVLQSPLSSKYEVSEAAKPSNYRHGSALTSVTMKGTPLRFRPASSFPSHGTVISVSGPHTHFGEVASAAMVGVHGSSHRTVIRQPTLPNRNTSTAPSFAFTPLTPADTRHLLGEHRPSPSSGHIPQFSTTSRTSIVRGSIQVSDVHTRYVTPMSASRTTTPFSYAVQSQGPRSATAKTVRVADLQRGTEDAVQRDRTFNMIPSGLPQASKTWFTQGLSSSSAAVHSTSQPVSSQPLEVNFQGPPRISQSVATSETGTVGRLSAVTPGRMMVPHGDMPIPHNHANTIGLQTVPERPVFAEEGNTFGDQQLTIKSPKSQKKGRRITRNEAVVVEATHAPMAALKDASSTNRVPGPATCMDFSGRCSSMSTDLPRAVQKEKSLSAGGIEITPNVPLAAHGSSLPTAPTFDGGGSKRVASFWPSDKADSPGRCLSSFSTSATDGDPATKVGSSSGGGGFSSRENDILLSPSSTMHSVVLSPHSSIYSVPIATPVAVEESSGAAQATVARSTTSRGPIARQTVQPAPKSNPVSDGEPTKPTKLIVSCRPAQSPELSGITDVTKPKRVRTSKRTRSTVDERDGVLDEAARREIASVCPAIVSSAGKEWRQADTPTVIDGKVAQSNPLVSPNPSNRNALIPPATNVDPPSVMKGIDIGSHDRHSGHVISRSLRDNGVDPQVTALTATSSNGRTVDNLDKAGSHEVAARPSVLPIITSSPNGSTATPLCHVPDSSHLTPNIASPQPADNHSARKASQQSAGQFADSSSAMFSGHTAALAEVANSRPEKVSCSPVDGQLSQLSTAIPKLSPRDSFTASRTGSATDAQSNLLPCAAQIDLAAGELRDPSTNTRHFNQAAHRAPSSSHPHLSQYPPQHLQRHMPADESIPFAMHDTSVAPSSKIVAPPAAGVSLVSPNHKHNACSEISDQPLRRGLRNRAGDNHCFLNVVIQSLWNLSSFREKMLNSEEHIHRLREQELLSRSSTSREYQDLRQGPAIRPESPLAPSAVPGPHRSMGVRSVAPMDVERRFGGPLSSSGTSSHSTRTSSQSVITNSRAQRVSQSRWCPGDPFGQQPVFSFRPSVPSTQGPAVSRHPTVPNRPTRAIVVPGPSHNSPISMSLRDQPISSNSRNMRFQMIREGGKSPADHSSGSSCSRQKDREGCVYCAFKTLFAHFAYGNAAVLPPDNVRAALMKSFRHTARFEEGRMEDAEETLEAVLEAFHHSHCRARGSPLASRISDGTMIICNPPCLAHQVFAMEFVDTIQCRICGDVSEPATTSYFVYRIYVSDLLRMLSQIHPAVKKRKKGSCGKHDPQAKSPRVQYPSLDFLVERLWKEERIGSSSTERQQNHSPSDWRFDPSQQPRTNPDMRSKTCRPDDRPITSTMQDEPSCKNCSASGSLMRSRHCITVPTIFCCSLIWPTESATREAISKVLSLIEASFSFSKAFSPNLINDAEPASATMIFRGFVCYTARHYIVFFFDWRVMRWILYDDARVQELQDWGTVLDLCRLGCMLPSILFYERFDGVKSGSSAFNESSLISVPLALKVISTNNEYSDDKIDIYRKHMETFTRRFLRRRMSTTGDKTVDHLTCES